MSSFKLGNMFNKCFEKIRILICINNHHYFQKNNLPFKDALILVHVRLLVGKEPGHAGTAAKTANSDQKNGTAQRARRKKSRHA